jgi:signal transduction histidine kinase/ActR/RegA family two-component response regulator
VSLRTRLIATLGATASFAILLALLFQERSLARDLQRAAAARLEHSAGVANRLVDAHLTTVSERYRAISGTPQLRANLEVEDPPTLAHYAEDLRGKFGAERIVFENEHGRVLAAAGNPAFDSLVKGAAASRLAAVDNDLYALTSVPIASGADIAGHLIALQRIAPETLRDWSELCGAEIVFAARTPSDSEALFADVRAVDGTWLRVESRLEAEHAALRRARELAGAAGALALCGALAASLVLSRSLASAMKQLLHTAERIGRGDLGARVALSRGDEVGELGVALNEMARRLEENATTVQRQHEELIAAKEKAEAANRAKTEFLANMSHEIRTPMSAVLGYSELLFGGEGQPAERDAWASAMRRNAADLLQLIDGILDISRVEAGQLELELRPCKLRPLVENTAAPIAQVAREKGLRFECVIDPSCPEAIQTDGARLRQILSNLLQNALKFTPEGSISLRVTREAPERVSFAVRDTGIGISAKDRERIFLPFGQADASHTRRFGGAGLGLSISQRLAHLLGGSLRVESELGHGSEFRLELPAAPCAVETQPVPRRTEAHRPQRAATGLRVLLAEDGIDNQRLIRVLLRPADVDLVLVENGAQALDQVIAALESGQPFDVVLMDMQMPVMDGYEATRRLRELGYQGRVVALTAHAMSGDRARCLEAGCDDYLTKPIDRARLLELVAEVSAQRKPDVPDQSC